MRYFFKRNSEYYKRLVDAGVNFLNKIERPYILITRLNCKGGIIHMLIPFHANVPKFIRDAGMFLELTSTNHTKNDRKAGLNLAGAIPYHQQEFRDVKKLKEWQIDDDRIIKENMPFLKQLMQVILNDLDNNEKLTYDIDLVRKIEILEECLASGQTLKRSKTKTNSTSNILDNNKTTSQTNTNTTKQNIDNNTFLRDFKNSSNKVDVAKKFKELHPEYIESIKKKVGANVDKSKDHGKIKDDTNKK